MLLGADLMNGMDEWTRDIFEQAWHSRNRALCVALSGPPAAQGPAESAATLPAHLFEFGSGAIRLSCEFLGLHAIADSSVWRNVPPLERTRQHSLPRVSVLEIAARRANVRLEVLLGAVEIDLPRLLDLRCGDVLSLPTRLDERVAVLCEGRPLAHGLLGAARNNKCVQLF